MDKKTSKKIYSTMVKLIAIIVSIFVFSYAWFVSNKENHLDNIEIGTVKANNLQISQTGEDGWGSVLSINSSPDLTLRIEPHPSSPVWEICRLLALTVPISILSKWFSLLDTNQA